MPYVEAIDYMKKNPGVWDDLAPTLGVTSKEGAELLRSRIEKSFVTRWDEKYIARQLDFAKQVQELLGQKYLPAIPADGFTTRFSP